jgi:hypothetical protein
MTLIPPQLRSVPTNEIKQTNNGSAGSRNRNMGTSQFVLFASKLQETDHRTTGIVALRQPAALELWVGNPTSSSDKRRLRRVELHQRRRHSTADDR